MGGEAKNWAKRLLLCLLCLAIAGAGVVLAINGYMQRQTAARMLSAAGTLLRGEEPSGLLGWLKS